MTASPDMGTPEQIFIVGMNGSGTTMLLDHLSNHSRIFGFPVETKSLPYFLQHERDYGDLRHRSNFSKLWQEMKKSIGDRAGSLKVEVRDPGCEVTSPAAAFDYIMRTFAQAGGKAVWCEKTPMHVHHLGLLASAFPRAKFVHVIRDGRDCAASFHRRWQFNPMRTIYRWKRAVRAGRRHSVDLSSRYYEVRYEAVTREPETALRGLMEFLGLQFEDALLNSARKRPDTAASRTETIVRNERQAVQYFDSVTLREMESIAGCLLTELGYPCANRGGDVEPSRIQLASWRVGDDMRRLATVVFRRGRIIRPAKWRYIVARLRNALKQRSSNEV